MHENKTNLSDVINVRGFFVLKRVSITLAISFEIVSAILTLTEETYVDQNRVTETKGNQGNITTQDKTSGL